MITDEFKFAQQDILFFDFNLIHQSFDVFSELYVWLNYFYLLSQRELQRVFNPIVFVIEVVLASGLDARKRFPFRGDVPGTSNWVDAPGKPPDQLKGLHILSGLGALGAPQKELEIVVSYKEV